MECQITEGREMAEKEESEDLSDPIDVPPPAEPESDDDRSEIPYCRYRKLEIKIIPIFTKA